jgi:hypothetical protein
MTEGRGEARGPTARHCSKSKRHEARGELNSIG